VGEADAPLVRDPPAALADPRRTSSSPLLDLLPHFIDTLRREPALAISLTYLLVAMAGIFYDVSFYRLFGIPVLSLAQLGDFLTAGIQQPMALVLVFSTFPLCWVFDRINERFRQRHRDDLAKLEADRSSENLYGRARRLFLGWRVRQLWYTRLNYLVLIFAYGWIFVGYYADHRAEAVKRGDAAEVRVWLNGESAAMPSSASDTWTYLGATSSYVFVYDRAGNRSSIVPVNAIARIAPVVAPPTTPAVVVAPIP
jgi:hypothetical protein